MAKRKIANYTFYPGIGKNENRFPDAWSLISQNKEFIKKEVTAWIGDQVAQGASDFTFDRAKCLRDLQYIADAIAFDVAIGTNYNANFQGLAETNSLDLSETVISAITNLQSRLRDLSSVKASSTAYDRVNLAFEKIIDIAQNGTYHGDNSSFAEPYIWPEPSTATASEIAVKDRIIANRDFIVAEINAWVAVQYPNADHNVEKCSRDIKYALNAVIYDILYGGNSASYDSAKFFNYLPPPYTGITAEHKAQTVAAYQRLRSIIQDVVQNNGIVKSNGNNEDQDLTGDAADQADATRCAQLIQIVEDVVNTGTSALPATRSVPSLSWVSTALINAKNGIDNNSTTIIAEVCPDAVYTYNAPKCERDTGLNVDAYLYDLRYGGNQETRRIASTYFEGEVAQVDGSRTPEIRAKEFTRDLINNHVLNNAPQSVPYQNTVAQVVDNTKNAENGASNRIGDLIKIVTDVLDTGLTALPELQRKGMGHVRFIGSYQPSDILLITNSTHNEVIYNFADALKGGTTTIERDDLPRDSSGYTPKFDYVDANQDADTDFPKYLQTTDAVTTVDLVFNTENYSSSDSLQIFVEQLELITRPFDFGTDAIERMRVAAPLSMLDADFEYGLQPTKWSAIATMRGYPSVYEIPGTDTEVRTVTTDASEGTDGVGASLITVQTQGQHGFEAGTAITIKALEDSVLGASRAEGSFVIVTVPTPTTFTYYAKAKVGTASGQVLSTTYTQLRKANFYTGSTIGRPQFVIASDGTAGQFTLSLTANTGSNRLAFTGSVPEIGAPLVDANIPEGAQVTAVSQTPDGNALNPDTTADITAGQTQFEVVDATGIVTGLAADNGSGEAIFVTNVVGTTVTMSGQFTTNLTRTSETYSGVSGTTTAASGVNAEFTISRNAGSYAVDAVDQAGFAYNIGDEIIVDGADVGGVSSTNDATIRVETVNGTGGILTASVTGTAVTGSITYSAVNSTYNNGNGTISSFIDVTGSNGAWTTVDFSSPNDSVNFEVGDRLKISGSSLGAGATDGSQTDGGNDVIIKVTAIGAGGGITSAEIDNSDWSQGVPPPSTASYDFGGVGISFTGGSGTGFEFRVSKNGTQYSVQTVQQGTGYTTADTIIASGTDLGGTSPANDVYLRISEVGGSGEIIDYRVEGPDISSLPVGSDEQTYIGKTANPLNGSLAEFDVSNDGVAYSVTIATAGQEYHVDQTFTVPGTELGGTSPANDATITITQVLGGASNGAIDQVTISGSAPALQNQFTGVTGTNSPNDGADATFDITRVSGNQYGTAVVSATGQDYKVGNTITIPGTALGGASPANDAIVTVTGLGADGAVTDATVSGTSIAGDTLSLVNSLTMSEFTTDTISSGTTISFEALATIQVDFDYAHGIVPGDTFIVTIDSDDGVNNHALAQGAFIAINVPTTTRILYSARAEGSIDTTNNDIIRGSVYMRPDSFFIHRPYDGGVQLGTGGPQHGAQAIRQSKKYIRYQSGKGIMYTTGALFAPSYDIRAISSNGTTIGSDITVTTDDNDHGLQVGGRIRLLGVETSGYNGEYDVTEVLDERRFKVRASRRLGDSDAIIGFAAQVTVVNWHGATVRSGIFDDQNGIFWEYDGTNLSVAQRTSTKQVAGTIGINPDENIVTGNNTRFRDQLSAGDRIVIKGMTHVVSHIDSQTSMTVTPDYRGVNPVQAAKVCLVSDKKVLQQNWNRDKLDGTGPSGYKIDPRYMQMIGIQYSWYGAGFIDWMLRGADGNFVFCHRMRNSNVNTEAFMRSGNLPVRYEVTNEGAISKLSANIDATQTTIPIESAEFFPSSGTVYIDNEIINFTGVDYGNNTLTGATRGAAMTNFQAGATRQYNAGPATTHDKRTGVILISNTITPLISHWGSAFLTDGLFDEDRGYIFSYAETGVEVSTTKRTAFLLRLAPSVSNAIIGDLGDRELLNRAQLLMNEIEITSESLAAGDSGGIVLEGILNPQNYPVNPSDVGWTGLSGLAQGGQPSFAQIASGGSVVWNSGTSETIGNATVMPETNVSVQMMPYNLRRQSYAYFTQASWEASNLEVGDEVNDPKFSAGTTITQVSDQTYAARYFVRFSTRSNGDLRPNETIQFKKGGDDQNRNFVYFTQASWEAGGARSGTEVANPPTDQTDISFPSNTIVNSVEGPLLFGNPDSPGNFIYYYKVTFNNAYSGTVSPGDIFNFVFRQPPYAQPGETVFSFIAVPGERSVLNLATLKELTNTTLGGRGTFPNGPDVLAINVYKTEGDPLNTNVILKWGEAQA